MIVLHPRIYPFDDPSRPRRTVEALRVANGLVTALGSEAEILGLRASGEAVVRPEGACVLPGLIDSHAHLTSLGARPGSLDVPDDTKPQDIAARVREAVRELPVGAWLTGRAWNQAVWGNAPGTPLSPAGFPTHDLLTAASPDVPVMLHRTDQHAMWLNRAAMEAAGLWRTQVADPPGGTIDRDERGFATGVLVDEAVGLAKRAMPPVSSEERQLLIIERARRFLAAGVTTVHCALIWPSEIDDYRAATKGAGATGLRVRGMVHADPPELATWAMRNLPEIDPDDVFHLVTLKAFADGALGSRGAWMFEPYVGTDGVGKPVATPEEVEQLARVAIERGFQLATHAIGDRALRETMDAYARGGWAPELASTLRFRIEHVQHTRPEDLDRMAELRLAAPMQPIHCTRDMRYCDALIGEARGALSYPWRGVLRRGMRLGFGSDFPIETLNPWMGIHAAVTRQDEDGSPGGGWNAHECVSTQEALEAYLTGGAALIVADEGRLGQLRAGPTPGASSPADFIAVDTDPFAAAPEEILRTEVLATFVAGTQRSGLQ